MTKLFFFLHFLQSILTLPLFHSPKTIAQNREYTEMQNEKEAILKCGQKWKQKVCVTRTNFPDVFGGEQISSVYKTNRSCKAGCNNSEALFLPSSSWASPPLVLWNNYKILYNMEKTQARLIYQTES